MAKISQYPNAGAKQDTDEFVIARDGKNYKMTGDELGDPTWSGYSAATPTRASTDDPTYVLTFPGVDLTGFISEGMKLKFTQDGTVRYFFVSKDPTFSTDTTLTVYGGTDYNVDNTGTYPISDVFFSNAKAPYGFPLSPAKWDFVVTDTTLYVKTSPTDDTWYSSMDSGSLPSIDIPIGTWDVTYSALMRGQVPSASSNFLRTETTLSTSSSSESDASFNVSHSFNAGGDGAGQLVSVFPKMSYSPKTLSLTSKTTYYLLSKIDVTANPTSIQIQGSASTTVITAACTYL